MRKIVCENGMKKVIDSLWNRIIQKENNDIEETDYSKELIRNWFPVTEPLGPNYMASNTFLNNPDRIKISYFPLDTSVIHIAKEYEIDGVSYQSLVNIVNTSNTGGAGSSYDINARQPVKAIIIDDGCMAIPMPGIFQNMGNLEYISLGTMEPGTLSSKYYTLSYLFMGCRKLKRIDGLSNLILIKDSPQQTNLKRMFYQCESLEEVDLSFLTISPECNIENMFYGCTSLRRVIIGGWTRSTDPKTELFGETSPTEVIVLS